MRGVENFITQAFDLSKAMIDEKDTESRDEHIPMVLFTSRTCFNSSAMVPNYSIVLHHVGQ